MTKQKEKKTVFVGLSDFVATGHYAKIIEDKVGYHLLRGIDDSKDQSYFLWPLKKEQLPFVLFPLGDSRKEDLRKEAKVREIPVAEKKDSQGICFLGDVEMEDFLGQFISLKEGDVLSEDGDVVGKHKGAALYTEGQRHGFSIDSKEQGPWYVLGKDCKKNTIFVGKEPPSYTEEVEIFLTDVVQREGIFAVGENLMCQTRYHGEEYPCVIDGLNSDTAIVRITKENAEITVGQSLVVYAKDVCVLGGIIDKVNSGNSRD
jgi:tRNA-specific 2-thiouridylase